MILDGRPLVVDPALRTPEPILAGVARPKTLIGQAAGPSWRRTGVCGGPSSTTTRAGRTRARDPSGTVIGGVRLAPVTAVDIGWWKGGRLAVARGSRARDGERRGVGAALVRAACAVAESRGVLRFEADVQPPNEAVFARLGWLRQHLVQVADRPHVRMRWPIGRIARLAADTKRPLGRLLSGMLGGVAGFIGDDGAPVPGSDLVAACDAIVPAMVEASPSGPLVRVLAAMGATPVGLLDALGARNADAAGRVLSGVRAASARTGSRCSGDIRSCCTRVACGDGARTCGLAGAGRGRPARARRKPHGGSRGSLAAGTHRSAMGLDDEPKQRRPAGDDGRADT